jgi:flagellar hook-length control protein FliK
MVLSGLAPQPVSERDIMRTLDLEADRSENASLKRASNQEGSASQTSFDGSSQHARAAVHGTLAQLGETSAGTGRISQSSSDPQRFHAQEDGPDRPQSRHGEQSAQTQLSQGKATQSGGVSDAAGVRQDNFAHGHADRMGETQVGTANAASALSSATGRAADQLAALTLVASNAQITNKSASNGAGHSPGSAVVGVGSAGRQQSILGSPLSRPAQTQQGGRGTSAEAALHAQLSRGLAQAMRSGEGTATIRLDPQHMGSLRVDVTVREGFVEAIFRPSTIEAQRLLEADSSALEQALHTRGLRVDRIEIRPAHESAVPAQMFDAPAHDKAMDGDRGDAEQQGTEDSMNAHGGRGSDTHREQGDESTGAGGTLGSGRGTELPGPASSAAESADTIQTRAEPGGLWSSIDTIA